MIAKHGATWQWGWGDEGACRPNVACLLAGLAAVGRPAVLADAAAAPLAAHPTQYPQYAGSVVEESLMPFGFSTFEAS